MAPPQRASERLRAAKERILAEWERQVRESSPPARAQDPLALRDSLPGVLDGLAAALHDPDPGHAVREQERLALEHGRHRAEDRSYSLEQVIREYHVLHRVLLGVLEEGGQDLSRGERDLLCDALFIAVRGAAAEFTQAREHHVQQRSQENEDARLRLVHSLGERSSEALLKDKLLQTIFERVEDYALFTLDATGRITSWARGAERIKQFTKRDVLGKHFSMLYPEDGRVRNEPQKHLEIAAREGRFRGEGLRQRKSGELFLADVFITPMQEGDRVVGYFKIVSDLTERNRVIQERDLSRTRVESLELERELRERFILTLSHDLRTPLSAARMSAQLIARRGCTVEQHAELAHRAARNLQRVDRMVMDLLDVSRIKAGQPVSLSLEEFDLVREVEDICGELGTVYGDRFRLDAPASLAGFWDRHGLKRVLENLLTNGVKYGDPVGVVTTRLREAGERVLITVHNLGSVIQQKDQDSLFDLFRRTEPAVMGGRQGWGLGLTLVRGITEAHGGIVTVRSLPSEGTSFILDLPRDARRQPTAPATPP